MLSAQRFPAAPISIFRRIRCARTGCASTPVHNKVNTRGKDKYKKQPINTEDGLRIDFDNDWVHLRTSNTEPIIRIYAESGTETTAANIAKRLMADIKEMMMSKAN